MSQGQMWGCCKTSFTAFNRITLLYPKTGYHPKTTQKLPTSPIQNFHNKENPATKTNHKTEMSNESQAPPLQSGLTKKNKGIVKLQVITTTQQAWAPGGDFIARPKKHQHSPKSNWTCKVQPEDNGMPCQELLLMQPQLTTKWWGFGMLRW